MRSCFTLVAAAVVGACSIAHANTISIYNLDSTLSNGTAKGTVTLDATTGLFTDANITLATSLGTAVFTGAPAAIATRSTYTQNIFSYSGLPLTFSLFLPGASLVGYTGGSLCTVNSPCGTNFTSAALMGYGMTEASSGTLTLLSTTGTTPNPVAVTPEPSSLILLGTGVLAVGALLRRRSI